MRKFLVRNIELSTHITLFGKTFVTLRAPRILFPLFVLCGIVIVGDPATYTFYWYHVPAYLALLGGIWMGFFHYRFFPYSWADLDFEQQYFYMLFYRKVGGHTKSILPTDNPYWFANYLSTLKTMMQVGHSKRFVGLKSLLGLLIGIVSIVIWYLAV